MALPSPTHVGPNLLTLNQLTFLDAARILFHIQRLTPTANDRDYRLSETIMNLSRFQEVGLTISGKHGSSYIQVAFYGLIGKRVPLQPGITLAVNTLKSSDEIGFRPGRRSLQQLGNFCLILDTAHFSRWRHPFHFSNTIGDSARKWQRWQNHGNVEDPAGI